VTRRPIHQLADLDALIRNDTPRERLLSRRQLAVLTAHFPNAGVIRLPAHAHTLHSTDQEQPTAANRYRHAGAPLTVWTDSTDQD
jgi:hypothetical protein